MPEHERAWIGLDLGTQSVRALAVTARGDRLASATRPLRSTRLDRRHEQDPHAWWTATADALREVTAHITGHPVGGVAACATSGTILLTDAEGRPLTPGIMYDDTRAAERPEILSSLICEGDELWQRLGHRPQASWGLATLVHLQRSGAWPTGARVCHQGDVITRQLSGRPVPTDANQALKTGLDLTTLRWPDGLFDRIGLDTTAFPEVVLPGTPIATVCEAAAEATGLPAGTPVVAGTTDGCAAQFAAGALRPGRWNTVLGTTLVVKGVSVAPVREPTGAVYSHRAPHHDYWLPGGASSTGAGTVSALFGDAVPDSAPDRLPDWPDVPIAYPLAGIGERFPFVAPDAVGIVAVDGEIRPGIGALAALPPSTALAAVMLGVACLERLCYDLLAAAGAPPVHTVSFTGGATRNATWNQLRCDMLGVPVEIPAETEPALGSALLAASSAPGTDPVELADSMIRTATVLEPTPSTTGLTDAYRRFRDLLGSQGWLEGVSAGSSRQGTSR